MIKVGDTINVNMNGRVIVKNAKVVKVRYEDDANDIDHGYSYEYEFVGKSGKLVKDWEHEANVTLVASAVSEEPVAATTISNSDRIIAEIKAIRAKNEAEAAEFKAMMERRYAEFREKSKSPDWQVRAQQALREHSLTAIYNATNCFARGVAEHSLFEAGLATKHMIGIHTRAAILTETGYMLVWARGTSYYPGVVMEGL